MRWLPESPIGAPTAKRAFWAARRDDGTVMKAFRHNDNDGSMLTWSGGGSGQSCQKSNNTIEAIVLVSFKMSGILK